MVSDQRLVYDIFLDICKNVIEHVSFSPVSPAWPRSRDVSVDFVTLPGVVRDGEIKVEGIRVYMSHTAAQALARKLETLIEDAHNNKLIAELEFQPTEDDSLEK